MIAAGQPAPEFTLRNQDGEKVSLSDFRGRKVLLVFYPLDFSPVCSDQLSIYQEVKPEIEAKGVQMIGISVDSGFAHKAFQEKLGIDTPLLADFEPKGEVARARSRVPTAPTSSRSATPTARWSWSTPRARSSGCTSRRRRWRSPAPT
jgi:peroxiredoxin